MKDLFRNYRDVITSILIAIGSSVWFWLIRVWLWRFDDSFFGYTYAKNLAIGNGFTFNGEKVIGTSASAPVLLYETIYKIIQWFGGAATIRDIAEVISFIALVGIAISAFLFIAKVLRNYLAGVIAAIFVVGNFFLLSMFGHESILAILFMFLTLILWHYRRYTSAALLFSMAFLCRAESIFLGITLLYFYLSQTTKLSLKAIVTQLVAPISVFILPIISWFIFSYIYFHQIFSNSLSFKIIQTGIIGKGWLYGLGSYIKLMFFRDLFSQLAFVSIVIVVLLSLVYLVRQLFVFTKDRRYKEFLLLSLVFATTVIPIGVYLILSITFYHWFLFLPVVSMIVLSGIILESFIRWFGTLKFLTKKPILIQSLRIVFIVVILLPQCLFVYDQSKRMGGGRTKLYEQVGMYLRDHTQKEDTIGYIEVGQIAYFSERKIIDVTGMVTEGVIDAHKRGDRMYAYSRYKPDYIILDSPGYTDWLIKPREDEYFKQNYSQVHVFMMDGIPTLFLYKHMQ